MTETTNENLPTHSASSTKWKIDQLIFLEEHFGDSTALIEGLDTLTATPAILPELINNLLYYINDIEALEEAMEVQLKALKERSDRYKKQRENLRNALKALFERFELTKLECPLGTVSKVTRTNSSLVISDETELLMNQPELFVKQPPKLNKDLLKSRLKAGETIEGAKLVDSITIAIRT